MLAVKLTICIVGPKKKANHFQKILKGLYNNLNNDEN